MTRWILPIVVVLLLLPHPKQASAQNEDDSQLTLGWWDVEGEPDKIKVRIGYPRRDVAIVVIAFRSDDNPLPKAQTSKPARRVISSSHNRGESWIVTSYRGSWSANNAARIMSCQSKPRPIKWNESGVLWLTMDNRVHTERVSHPNLDELLQFEDMVVAEIIAKQEKEGLPRSISKMKGSVTLQIQFQMTPKWREYFLGGNFYPEQWKVSPIRP